MLASKFTKADLVSSLYEKSGVSRKEIVRVLDLFMHEMKSALVHRRIIELRGFGTFEVKVRKARTGVRNPRTGEDVLMHSHGVVTFRAGRDLKNSVWALAEGGTPQPDMADGDATLASPVV